MKPITPDSTAADVEERVVIEEAAVRLRVSVVCLNGQHQTCYGHDPIMVGEGIARGCGCPDPSHAAEDDHNHSWERTDGVLCCACGAWLDDSTKPGEVRDDPYASSAQGDDPSPRTSETAVRGIESLIPVKPDPRVPPGVVVVDQHAQIERALEGTPGQKVMRELAQAHDEAAGQLTPSERARVVAAHSVLDPRKALDVARDLVREALSGTRR